MREHSCHRRGGFAGLNLLPLALDATTCGLCAVLLGLLTEPAAANLACEHPAVTLVWLHVQQNAIVPSTLWLTCCSSSAAQAALSQDAIVCLQQTSGVQLLYLSGGDASPGCEEVGVGSGKDLVEATPALLTLACEGPGCLAAGGCLAAAAPDAVADADCPAVDSFGLFGGCRWHQLPSAHTGISWKDQVSPHRRLVFFRCSSRPLNQVCHQSCMANSHLSLTLQQHCSNESNTHPLPASGLACRQAVLRCLTSWAAACATGPPIGTPLQSGAWIHLFCRSLERQHRGPKVSVNADAQAVCKFACDITGCQVL